MRSHLSSVSACWMVVVCLGAAGNGLAVQYDLHPGDNMAQVQSLLQPGDTVVLHAGTYGHTWLEDIHGTPDGWITFKGAEGEARPLIRYDGSDKNVIDVYSVSYVKFQYLEITGGGDGIKFGYGSSNHDVILEDLKIHAVGNVAINASSIAELAGLTVRNCNLYGTGRALGGHGEGLYLGVASGSSQPQVHDSLIEHNYIHDLGGSHGDGVEIKHGCYNVVVQDNVFSVHYSCPSITVWGTYKDDPAYNNIIRRNLIWRPVDAGVQATGETTIENNIIVGAAQRGLSIRNRDDGRMQHMRIVNNTIWLAEGDAAVSLYGWDAAYGGTNLVMANNAIFQASDTAVAIKGFTGLENGTFSGNLIYGTIQLPSMPTSLPGLTPASPPSLQFFNPSIAPAGMNFYPKPGSELIDAADPAYVPWGDFSLQGRPSGAGFDVGAYEVGPTENPGWQLTLGFKDMDAVAPGPSPVLSVSPSESLSLRAWPGEFVLPVSRTYTVSNTGAVRLDWTASFAATWGAIDNTGGSLEPGQSATVTISVNDGVNALAAGHYSVPLRFTNTLNGEGNKAVPVEVVALSPARLDVSPETGLSGVKMIGGYDTPWCLYTVSNGGDFPLAWTASADQPWVLFTVTAGTLQPQESATLYAYIGWEADALGIGTYTATITFDGSASQAGVQTRPVSVRMTWLGDLNADGAVDVADLLILVPSFGTTWSDAGYNQVCDMNYDGAVDVVDLLMMVDNWGKGT